MSKKENRIPSALKHGCYSGLTLLPTEDRDAFNKLHRDLIAEFQPVGRTEEIIILQLANLTWRRENLAIYGLATRAQQRRSSIYYELDPPPRFEMPVMYGAPEPRNPEELRALREEANEQAQRELGELSPNLGDERGQAAAA